MIFAALVMLVILQVTDYYLTMDILSKGGVEKNRVLRSLFRIFGPSATIIGTKMIAMTALVAAGWDYRHTDTMFWLVISLCVFYCWVVGHNFNEALKVT